MPNPMSLTRGDRRRDDKLAALRSIVRPELAVVAVDLAERKQAAVVANHDSMIFAKRMFDGEGGVIGKNVQQGPVVRGGDEPADRQDPYRSTRGRQGDRLEPIRDRAGDTQTDWFPRMGIELL